MSEEDSALLRKISMSFFALAFFWSTHAVGDTKTVYVEDNAQKRLAIATVDLAMDGSYSLTFKEELFGDYFLSMRPFRCIDTERLVCHQPYPYKLNRILKDGDLRPLEYDLLFITKAQEEYGIDPYNGRYYILKETAKGYEGVIQGIDLNVLASPPEGDILYPITVDDLDEMEADSVQYPRIIIE